MSDDTRLSVPWIEGSRLWSWNRARWLRHLPVGERERVWHEGLAAAGWERRGCALSLVLLPVSLVLALAFVAGCVALSAMLWVDAAGFRFAMPLIALLGFGFGLITPQAVLHTRLHRICRKSVQRLVVSRLSTQRVPACLWCKYPTEGLAPAGRSCPECGMPISPDALME